MRKKSLLVTEPGKCPLCYPGGCCPTVSIYVDCEECSIVASFDDCLCRGFRFQDSNSQ